MRRLHLHLRRSPGTIKVYLTPDNDMAAPKPPGSKLSTMDLRATETGDTKDVATVGRLRDTEMDGMEDVATAEHGSNIQNISSAMKLVLETLGEDTSRDGLRKTPERFAKAIVSLTSGYNLNPVNILKDAIFEEDCHDLVVVKDISFSSLCEHHLLPFFDKVSADQLSCNLLQFLTID